ncbi:hypothetical protein A4X03_0g6198 [Tilletia caries]|uniref:Uncharacterized protein n=1 Tax=Tilletia caries TaxID=13290 RepID=A0A8T8T1T6_9BASI|nr:hypothetical protein A4X03_0g6198 [Tilletia caries]
MKGKSGGPGCGFVEERDGEPSLLAATTSFSATSSTNPRHYVPFDPTLQAARSISALLTALPANPFSLALLFFSGAFTSHTRQHRHDSSYERHSCGQSCVLFLEDVEEDSFCSFRPSCWSLCSFGSKEYLNTLQNRSAGRFLPLPLYYAPRFHTHVHGTPTHFAISARSP